MYSTRGWDGWVLLVSLDQVPVCLPQSVGCSCVGRALTLVSVYTVGSGNRQEVELCSSRVMLGMAIAPGSTSPVRMATISLSIPQTRQAFVNDGWKGPNIHPEEKGVRGLETAQNSEQSGSLFVFLF